MNRLTHYQTIRHQAISITNSGSITSLGITLPEMLVVIVIGGVLMAILAPAWLGWHAENRLVTAQDEVFQAMRQTQIRALNTRQTWRVGFRQTEEWVEWTMFPIASPANAQWQALVSGVQIAPAETTLRQEAGMYFVEFNHKGHVTPPFGRISFSSNWSDYKRRCVFVSTLLGVLRKASDKACYR